MGISIRKSVSAIATIAVMCMSIPVSYSVYADDTDAVFVVSSDSGSVGDDASVSVTCNTDVEFVSATFELHYDPAIVDYKSYEILSQDLTSDDISFNPVDSGIIYVVVSVDNITNADVRFNFSIVGEGTSDMTLDVKKLLNDSDEDVPYSVTNGTITGSKPEEPPTETTTTSESTTTETTTTTSETSSTSTSMSTDVTSTSSESVSNSTTTSVTTTSTESESNSQSTTQATQPATSSTTSTSQSTTSAASTTKATTTTKVTTTSINNKNSNGSVPTGDNFPLALLLASAGVAGVALVKTSPRKKDEE